MKNFAIASLLALGFASFSVFAAEPVTITGEGSCARCALKQVTKCQNAITILNDKGKKEIIYLEHNGVSKDFHDVICLKAVKITATGTLEEKDGDKVLTPTKIEEAK
jgi:hypothetical protein